MLTNVVNKCKLINLIVKCYQNDDQVITTYHMFCIALTRQNKFINYIKKKKIKSV